MRPCLDCPSGEDNQTFNLHQYFIINMPRKPSYPFGKYEKAAFKSKALEWYQHKHRNYHFDAGAFSIFLKDVHKHVKDGYNVQHAYNVAYHFPSRLHTGQ